MMTKEELKSYLQKRGLGEAMNTWPIMPTTFSSVTFDNVKDALQMKYDYVSYLDNMATELIDGRGGTVILFDDRAELYTNDPKFYTSSNTNGGDGVKLKMLHDAFKAVPRQTGLPEDISAFVRDELQRPLTGHCKNVFDELVDYLKSIGVKWASELSRIAYPVQAGKATTPAKESKKSNVVLNASIKELKNTRASDKISITVDGVDIQLTTQQVRDYIAAREAMEPHETEVSKEPIGLLTAGKRDFKVKPISGLIDVDFVWSVVNRDTFDQVCGELNIREKERILRTIDRELKFALTRDDGKRWIHPNEQKFDIEDIGKRGTIYLRSQSIRFVILKLGHRHRFRIFDINATVDAINKWTDAEYAKFDTTQQQARETTKTLKGDVKVEVSNVEKKDEKPAEPTKKEEPIEPEIVSEPKANTAA